MKILSTTKRILFQVLKNYVLKVVIPSMKETEEKKEGREKKKRSKRSDTSSYWSIIEPQTKFANLIWINIGT